MNAKIEATRNIGISLLKILMSFTVIVCHFGVGGEVLYLAVPCFMMISFLLLGDRIIYKDAMQERIKRLFFPQVVWAIVYYMVYKLVFGNGAKVQIEDLIWQIFLGTSSKLNSAMWFQADLIILTIIIYMVFNSMKKNNAVKFLFVLMIFSIVAQYSGWNFKLFGSLRYELKWPLGRICEMFPYAILGTIFNYFKIYNFLESRKKMSIITTGILIVFVWNNSFISNPAESFIYAGIRYIVITVLIVTFFWLFPFDKFLNRKLTNLIHNLSKYSLGIYCIHLLVGYIVNELNAKYNIVGGTLRKCILIYIVSMILSYIITLIPNETVKKMVV